MYTISEVWGFQFILYDFNVKITMFKLHHVLSEALFIFKF